MSVTEIFEDVERTNTALPSRAKDDSGSNHESETLSFIEECLAASASPVCLCSFGKDSLVLLHLIMRIKKIPVIYWREPFFQSKFSFPQKIAEMWDLEIYDYPPTYTDYIQLDDYFEILNFYQTGLNVHTALYTGIRKYRDTDKKYLCAIKDLLMRPKVSDYQFGWDCVFHGHKQSDRVYVTDKIDLPKVKLNQNNIFALPIRDWTDENIWEYIYKYDLPYNKERYLERNENANNDVFPTCYACLDYRNKEVICPKTQNKLVCRAKTKEEHEMLKNFLINTSYK